MPTVQTDTFIQYGKKHRKVPSYAAGMFYI